MIHGDKYISLGREFHSFGTTIENALGGVDILITLDDQSTQNRPLKMTV